MEGVSAAKSARGRLRSARTQRVMPGTRPSGMNRNDRDKNDAQQDQPARDVAADDILEDDDQRGADHRPKQRAGAASDDHQQRFGTTS